MLAEAVVFVVALIILIEDPSNGVIAPKDDHNFMVSFDEVNLCHNT